MKVPIARTQLLQSEIESVLTPLETGWLVQGPKVNEFESKWSEFTHAKNSIAVTSCTTALHLSLAALGFGKDDEAIVPAFTWISTANVVEHLGGKVVFCDIDPLTFNIDPNQIEEKITNKTKVILPVHLFGLSADMDPINEIAKRRGLWVVEDAACGFGAKYKGLHVGNLSNAGCFSFHPRKAITTGEGGMVTTANTELADKIRCLRDHGATMSDLQRHLGSKPYLLADHPEAGFNQRMTDIQASLGSAQMERADHIVNERRRVASIYDKAFKDFSYNLGHLNILGITNMGTKAIRVCLTTTIFLKEILNKLIKKEMIGWKLFKQKGFPQDLLLTPSTCYRFIKINIS